MSCDKPLWLGEASKLQHFKCSVLKTRTCLIKLWYDTPKPQNADSRFSLNGHDKPFWVERGIKTATFQRLHFEDLHVLNQVVIWHSKAPKYWLQILSKWTMINHSDWGEASKLQHFKCSVLKTCMCFIKLWYDIWQSKAPKWWFQIPPK